jgi:hypothetical protein
MNATGSIAGLLSSLIAKKGLDDLRGTQKFHGSRTLSFYQIRALLRETGKVREWLGGQGMRTFSYWTLKT